VPKTLLSLWRGPMIVRETLADIAWKTSVDHKVGVLDMRAPTRGSKRVCAARKAFFVDAVREGHQHKVVAAYMNRTRADVSHTVKGGWAP
jgi:hypothetical protein